MIKIPINEILDRYSICLLKNERTDEDLSTEIKYYFNEIIKYPDYGIFLKQLYDINGEIWNLEADIRKGQEDELGLEEVGRRALKIRDKNKIRVSIKNEIVKYYEEGFIDIKVNHGAADE